MNIDNFNGGMYQLWADNRIAKTAKGVAMSLRTANYNSYFKMVRELVATHYIYGGLPSHIDEGWVEMNLPWNGHLGCFSTTVKVNGEEIKVTGIQRGTFTGSLSAYDRLDKYTIVSNNSLLNKTYRIDNSVEQLAISPDLNDTDDKFVLIKNNAYATTITSQVDFQIRKLVEIDMAWMNNIKRMSMPLVAVGKKDTQAQLTALYNETAATVPFITLDESMLPSLQNTNLFQRDVNDNGYLDLLMEQRKIVWGDLLEILGIMTVDTSKKERLVVDEANSQRDMVDAYTFTGLRMRQKAVEQINELGIFDEEITVKVNDEVDYGRTIDRFQREHDRDYIGNIPDRYYDSGE